MPALPSFAEFVHLVCRLQKIMSDSTRAAMLPLELTLVLAATRDMGIGLRGTLPWTGLKKEMAYFARITKRLAPGVSLGLSFTTLDITMLIFTSRSNHQP